MYKVAIIGAGNKGAFNDAPNSRNSHKVISWGHAVCLHSEFELLGFFDTHKEKAEMAANIWGGKALDDIGQADVIIITTPDDQHFSNLSWAKRNVPKLIICEKPLAVSMEEAVDLSSQFETSEIPVLFNYTRRFIPYFQGLKKDIKSGKYGKFLKGFLYFNRGWLHTATHFTDLVNYFDLYFDKIEIHEIETDQSYIWNMGLIFEKQGIYENIDDRTPTNIPTMYDVNTWQVLDNAINYLIHKEPLLCTVEDAFKALDACRLYMYI